MSGALVRITDRFGRVSYLWRGRAVRRENAKVYELPSIARRAAKNYWAKHPLARVIVEQA